MRRRDLVPGARTGPGSLLRFLDTLPRAPIADPMRAGLERFVAATGWTGGGEVEMIRDDRGTPWLQEINPRFPGWIFGATLAGINLPARLVGAVLGIGFQEQPPQSDAFTRVVIEIPVREDVSAMQA